MVQPLLQQQGHRPDDGQVAHLVRKRREILQRTSAAVTRTREDRRRCGGPRDDAGAHTDPCGSVPAVAGPDHQVQRSGHCRGSRHAGIRDAHVRAHRQFHRIPAARLRAIDARIATAQVSRASLSFTLVHLFTETRSEPATGRPRGADARPRSLALRPRLAAGLPWTDDRRKATTTFAATLGPRLAAGYGSTVPMPRYFGGRFPRAPGQPRRSQSPARRPAPATRPLSSIE